jgi:hypothetical protein
VHSTGELRRFRSISVGTSWGDGVVSISTESIYSKYKPTIIIRVII